MLFLKERKQLPPWCPGCRGIRSRWGWCTTPSGSAGSPGRTGTPRGRTCTRARSGPTRRWSHRGPPPHRQPTAHLRQSSRTRASPRRPPGSAPTAHRRSPGRSPSTNDICKNNNFKRIKLHGFRHVHCSLLFEAGLTIQEVQDRLGHGDIKTTMDIYAHVTEKQRDNVADKFANYINF